jgi:TP901 family phage tail tape measure protein
MQQLGLDFKQISANAQQVSHHAMSLGDSFKTAISKMGIWLGAGAVFFQSLAFIKEGVTYVNELNKSLTEISIVTGQSQQQVNALGDSYNKLAGSMGVTTNEIAQTAAGLYRQGLSADEASKRMRTVIQYAKISALDINTASEIMTAAINSMGVSGQKAADVWSYLGDATATGADEIGKAMQKVGGSAGALNLPFEQVSSWIAVISSRTRESAETIGQSVNICADLKESEIAGNP